MAKTPTRTETPAEARPVTFSIEELNKVVADAVAQALAVQKADMEVAMAALTAKSTTAANGRSERSLQNEILVVKAFKKQGFGLVKPHVDVKTYNKWLAEGLKVKEGEHSSKVKNLRLFHRSQCRPISAEERAELQVKNDEAMARHKATVVPINALPPQ